MLLVLLLTCLAGLPVALLCNMDYLESKLKERDFEKFFSHLNRHELERFQDYKVLSDISKYDSPYEVLVAVIEKLKNQVGYERDPARVAAEGAAKYGRLRLLSALVEEGNAVFADDSLVPHKGAYNRHVDVVIFCTELDANFNLYDYGKRVDIFTQIFNTGNTQMAFHLINQGVDVYESAQLDKIVSGFESKGLFMSFTRDFDFAALLLRRIENAEIVDKFFIFALKYYDDGLLKELLEFPQVQQYLQQVKYATSVLLDRHRQELFERVMKAGDEQDGSSVEVLLNMHQTMCWKFPEEFISLVNAARENPALLESFDDQSFQLISASPTREFLKMINNFFRLMFNFEDGYN